MRDAIEAELPDALPALRANGTTATVDTVAPCELRQGRTAGLRHVVIGNGQLRAEILLDKGANVRQVWHAPTDTRLLAESADWHEQLAAFARRGCRGDCYADHYEGGWQDVLPARARWPGGEIEHGAGVGEGAIVPWDATRLVCTPDAAHVVCAARVPHTGLHVVKRFDVRRGRATMRVTTEVRNPNAHEVRFAWVQHPALGGDLFDNSARVRLPDGEVRVGRAADGSHVDRSVGVTDVPLAEWVGAEKLLPAPGGADRFLTIAGVRRAACLLVSRTRGVSARLRWDASTFPHAWIWCSHGPSIRCVAVEPATTWLPELLPRPRPAMFRRLGAGESMSSWVEISCVVSRSK